MGSRNRQQSEILSAAQQLDVFRNFENFYVLPQRASIAAPVGRDCYK